MVELSYTCEDKCLDELGDTLYLFGYHDDTDTADVDVHRELRAYK